MPIARVFDTLSIYGLSAYVNDFNILGRTYRVTAQGRHAPTGAPCATSATQDAQCQGEMVPLGSVRDLLRHHTGPLSRGAQQSLSRRPGMQGGAARLLLGQASPPSRVWPPRSRRRASASMSGPRSLPGKVWPATPAIWRSSGGGVRVPVLAALYESWLAAAVILIVPMCCAGAMVGVTWRGLDNNILVRSAWWCWSASPPRTR